MRSGHVTTALKAIFIVAIFTVLIRQDLLSLGAIETAISRWPWVVGGWACMTGGVLIGTVRWHFLIHAQDIPIPLRRTVQSVFVGLFFNVFLPGTVSGDLVKGYYVARAVPGHIAATVSSVLFDRVAGLTGLVALATIALLVGGRGEWAGRLGDPIALAVVGAAVGIAVLFAALLGLSEDRDPILKILRRLAGRLPFLISPLRVFEGLRVYHAKRRITLASIVVSVVAHGFFVAAWVCYVRAMALEGIPAAALFVVVPVGMLVASIPIGPAGIGTGHAAFLAIFALLGSDRGADLFNLVLVFQFILAGIGGLVYLSVKANDPISPDRLATAMLKGSTQAK
ncbi:MAG: lysylphosphatidylglycerol synthase transmembrane domain-containing protein [Vicinamibacterales bacterium]|nr:lysylphosphatidylglycerol synthase transmembrane domain-containing protein [Vicinamibacterales bacterium]